MTESVEKILGWSQLFLMLAIFLASVVGLGVFLVALLTGTLRASLRRHPWGYGIWAVLFLSTAWFFYEIRHHSGRSPERIARDTARMNIAYILVMLRQYSQEHGTIPAGGNAQVMKALQFGSGEEGLNAAGEFIDPWGTPYRMGESNPGFQWVYSFGLNKIDEGGVPKSDDIASWQ